MENNELETLCNRIIEREIKPLGLTCRYKIENYLDGCSLQNLGLKSPGFNEDVKKGVLKKLGIKKDHIDYNYKKKHLTDDEKEILRIKIYETRKFEKRTGRGGYLELQECFKNYISDPDLFLFKTFKEYQNELKKLKNEVEK